MLRTQKNSTGSLSHVSSFCVSERRIRRHRDRIRPHRGGHFRCDHCGGQFDRHDTQRQVHQHFDPAQVRYSMWLDREKPPSPAASSFGSDRENARETDALFRRLFALLVLSGHPAWCRSMSAFGGKADMPFCTCSRPSCAVANSGQ